jgi:hypothetical protein
MRPSWAGAESSFRPLGQRWVFVVLDVLLICFMAAIAVFGVIHVAADLFICALVLPLLSSFPSLRLATYCQAS